MPGPVSIGRLARESGLSVSRIRQLADEGLVPYTVTAGGHRRFDLGVALDAVAERSGARKGIGSGREAGALAPPADRENAAREPAGGESTVGVSAAHESIASEYSARLPLAGVREDALWRDVVAHLGLDDRTKAGHTMHYAFTEMVNNAVDHSSGTTVAVRVTADARRLSFEVADDGIGVFRRLREGLGLPDDMTALDELSKGLRTTDPEHHTGEGIFFTSKALDSFELETDSLSWHVDNERGDQARGPGSPGAGTRVRGAIASDSGRDLVGLFDEYAPDRQVERTRIVVKLFEHGTDFVSRSEAKRLLAGLDRFNSVVLDFAGVERVGQGFVDETFRVWARAHPDTELAPVNMSETVAYMVGRSAGRSSGVPGGGARGDGMDEGL